VVRQAYYSGLFNSDGTIIMGSHESFDHASEALADTDASVFGARDRRADPAVTT